MAHHDIEIIEDAFIFCANPSAPLDQLYTGGIWAEGPAYFPALRCLVWSDIPNNRMLRWDELTNTTGVFRHDAGFTNGNTVDRQGRLVSCQQGLRRVVLTEHDGSTTVLAESWQGKRLNSPNDIVVKSDGSIWFTDPSYGLDSWFEGDKGESEIGGDHVYRICPQTKECKLVADDFCRPNGLAFSPDEKFLYIVDSGGIRYPDNPRHIRRFSVDNCNEITGGEVFAECTCGKFDGIRCDEEGRLWAAAMDGIHCLATDGTLMGKILIPEPASNLTFGGPRRNRMFITATCSLYSILLPVRGAKTF